MEFISWQKYYNEWKDKKPLNEIVANYNLWIYQYETFEQSLWLQKGGVETYFILQEVETHFILQENDEFLLQENGDKLIWLINE
jgi:hypothetical protein